MTNGVLVFFGVLLALAIIMATGLLILWLLIRSMDPSSDARSRSADLDRIELPELMKRASPKR